MIENGRGILILLLLSMILSFVAYVSERLFGWKKIGLLFEEDLCFKIFDVHYGGTTYALFHIFIDVGLPICRAIGRNL